MKRAFGISFLLLANIIILAHSAIPHHHHNGMPVAHATTHHEHDDAGHDHHHHDTEQPVKHDGNSHRHNMAEDCLLRKVYVKASNDERAFRFMDNDFAPFFCLFVLHTTYSIPKITDYGLPFRQKPYLISCLTEYISQSLGLRAPPVY
ncbi:MAG: hypothetical protein LBB85_02865 [Dysgonamonadaceae bacterium]|jgi:hypothetical protein|nr:hypothetical protein [Dysgonamonadaceae bacterium]